MAFLNKKNRIIDVALTDYGRQLMSSNQLEFSFYCFSDELIDYSGSLAESQQTGATLDDTVYKNYVPMDATQIRTKASAYPELGSFLFTVADNRDLLPALTFDSSSIQLNRTYEDKSLNEYLAVDLNAAQNKDVMMIADVDPVDLNDREVQYAAEQKLEREVGLFSGSGN